ncbi:hypothetical protein YC2023_048976 [Brassica napus]
MERQSIIYKRLELPRCPLRDRRNSYSKDITIILFRKSKGYYQDYKDHKALIRATRPTKTKFREIEDNLTLHLKP